MKKRTILVLVIALVAAMACFANGAEETATTDGPWSPTKDVEWVCTSKPGGGSDIFTQKIEEILKENGISTANIHTSYVTDGGGEIGRLQVSTTKGDKANHTLLTFNSGDLMPMCLNTDLRLNGFTPLAIMAVDKQLLFIGENSKYADWQDVMDAINAGEKVVMSGSRGDDIETYNALLAETGFTKAQLSYTQYDSTSGAITALLGGHVDLCMSKPAAADQYIEAGKMTPVLALSKGRFTSEKLKDTPCLSEFGDYEDVEVPVWRGVAAPADMSDAARAYWVEALKAVSESAEWDAEYISLKGLQSYFLGGADAEKYMADYQAAYLQKIGKDK